METESGMELPALVWEGERRASLIQAKFHELYSKHFQNQLPRHPYLLPAQGPVHAPLAPSNTQSPAALPPPRASAPPPIRECPRETSQAQLGALAGAQVSQGPFTGAKTNAPRKDCQNGGEGEERPPTAEWPPEREREQGRAHHHGVIGSGQDGCCPEEGVTKPAGGLGREDDLLGGLKETGAFGPGNGCAAKGDVREQDPRRGAAVVRYCCQAGLDGQPHGAAKGALSACPVAPKLTREQLADEATVMLVKRNPGLNPVACQEGLRNEADKKPGQSGFSERWAPGTGLGEDLEEGTLQPARNGGGVDRVVLPLDRDQGPASIDVRNPEQEEVIQGRPKRQRQTIQKAEKACAVEQKRAHGFGAGSGERPGGKGEKQEGSGPRTVPEHNRPQEVMVTRSRRAACKGETGPRSGKRKLGEPVAKPSQGLEDSEGFGGGWGHDVPGGKGRVLVWPGRKVLLEKRRRADRWKDVRQLRAERGGKMLRRWVARRNSGLGLTKVGSRDASNRVESGSKGACPPIFLQRNLRFGNKGSEPCGGAQAQDSGVLRRPDRRSQRDGIVDVNRATHRKQDCRASCSAQDKGVCHPVNPLPKKRKFPESDQAPERPTALEGPTIQTKLRHQTQYRRAEEPPSSELPVMLKLRSATKQPTTPEQPTTTKQPTSSKQPTTIKQPTSLEQPTASKQPTTPQSPVATKGSIRPGHGSHRRPTLERGMAVVEPEVLSPPTVESAADLAALRQSAELEALARKAPQPMCCICFTKYDERRCYLACDCCDRWYHADSFGYSPEVAAAMKRFQCPKCRRKGMPSGCPLANPALSLATPLNIRPKLHCKSRVVYVGTSEAKCSALGGQRRGLTEGPEAKSAEKAGQSEGSKRPPRSIPVGRRTRTGEACGSAVLTARAVVTKYAGPKKDSLSLAEASCVMEKTKKPKSSGQAAEGRAKTRGGGPVEVRKRPPLRLAGGTRPALLISRALPVGRDNALGEGQQAVGTENTTERSLARLSEPEAGQSSGNRQSSMPVATPPGVFVLAVPHSASAEGLGGRQDSGDGETVGRYTEAAAVASRTRQPVRPEIADALGQVQVSPSIGPEMESGWRAPIKAVCRTTESEGGGLVARPLAPRKRIQPTMVSSKPLSATGCLPNPGAVTGQTEPVLGASPEGPVLPTLAEDSWQPRPCQPVGSSLEGPLTSGSTESNRPSRRFEPMGGLPGAYSGGLVSRDVGRHSWPSGYYQAVDRAPWGGPVLPDRVHTGAARGQSARWSIDLSKVQEVDGRKVRIGAGAIDGVQQLM